MAHPSSKIKQFVKVAEEKGLTRAKTARRTKGESRKPPADPTENTNIQQHATMLSPRNKIGRKEVCWQNRGRGRVDDIIKVQRKPR